MEVPRWRNRGTNNRYHMSVAAVAFATVAKAVVAGCMAAVMVMEEVDDKEAGE